MSKPVGQYTQCEYCDGFITLDSPPKKERYHRAEVHILDGDILIPPAVVRAKHKKGQMDAHAASLSGYYCCAECLIKRINEILSLNKPNPKKGQPCDSD